MVGTGREANVLQPWKTHWGHKGEQWRLGAVKGPDFSGKAENPYLCTSPLKY